MDLLGTEGRGNKNQTADHASLGQRREMAGG
jgi:hypothetical protein